MAHERLILETASETLVIPTTDFLSLEVELDNELAGMFKLRLATRVQSSGAWTYVDDKRFQVWKPLTIHAGFETTTAPLISGYITHIKPEFSRDPAYCSVEIWGMDNSVLMDRKERLFAWPNETDSDIATKIFSLHHLSSVVTETKVRHDDKISTIIQRETDMQFLKRLALRNGFECYVDGNTGFFVAPQLAADPQPLLAVHCGETETNVNRFSLELNALTPVKVAMSQVDRLNKSVLVADVKTGEQRLLGRTDPIGLLPQGFAPGQVYVSMNTTTGPTEMETLCQELYHQAEWLVNAEGEIDGNHYAHVLKPHGTVTIKGIGEAYSGLYYVTHVTHTFRSTGYTQFFRAKRNGLHVIGTEKFAAPDPRRNRFL